MTYFIGIAALVALMIGNHTSVMMLMNSHSFYIVAGGTFIISLLLTPSLAWKGIFWLIRSSVRDLKDMKTDLTLLAANPMANVSDPYGLLSHARDLWEIGLTKEEFEKDLINRAETILSRRLSAAACLRNLGKYPPAMGMIGTVIGMIKLFGNLGTNLQQTSVGPQLALAMTATLYGLILANFVIVPLADRLEAHEEERRTLLDDTLKILFSHSRNQPQILRERLLHVG